MNNPEIEFKRATLALAADAETQIGLFPPFVCFGDELVLDWDDALQRVRGGCGLFEAEATEAIANLDRVITAFSGAHNASLFCDPEALREDPRWNEIRGLAVTVCHACGWELVPPWPSGATYVPSR
jgi:hypothetical protein